MCQHQPRCPDAGAPDRQAARMVASHPEQGWSLLCNGIVAFDDAGELRLAVPVPVPVPVPSSSPAPRRRVAAGCRVAATA